MIRFTVKGQCWSMKNGKTLTVRGGKPRMIKHWKARSYEDAFLGQVPQEYTTLALGSLEKPLSTTVTVFYPSRRQDLDVSIVYDLLQKAGVISNDLYIHRKVEVRETDSNNPRVEIEVDYLSK